MLRAVRSLSSLLITYGRPGSSGAPKIRFFARITSTYPPVCHFNFRKLRARSEKPNATSASTVGMKARLFAPGADDVLYLVDLSGYVFRAYHAVAPLTSPTGEPTGAVFGTVNMLERLFRQCRPSLLAVAMDSRTATFRKEIYPEYKANRPPPPEDLKHQMTRVAQVVEALGIPVLQLDGVEADDLIATAVHHARRHSLRTVIVSADKDLMQLVSDDTLMWDTMRDRVVGPTEVAERFGVEPSQMRDLLALMGDASDNVPGVPSVGPKTARDLLVQFQSLTSVFDHVDEIKRKKLKETLAANRDQALLSQRLVSLKADCPMSFDLDALRFGGRDLGRLRGLYRELGFFRLLERLDVEVQADDVAVSPEPPAAEAAQPPQHSIVRTREALEEFVRAARSAGHLSVTVQTCSSDRHRPTLAGLGLGCSPGRAAYVPISHRYMGVGQQLSLETVREVLSPVLQDDRVSTTTHDLKRLHLVLDHNGLCASGPVFDTLLASYLLDPEARHETQALAQRDLGTVVPPRDELTGSGKKRVDFEAVPIERASEFATTEVDAITRLRAPLAARLEEEQLSALYERVELPLAPVLAQMERWGVALDVERLATIGRWVADTLQELEQHAQRVAGRTFNVNSPRQLETLLFDEMGLKPVKRTKTSRSTDAATLEVLAEYHELPRIILEYRKLAKLMSTYIDALPSLVNPATGRIHTSWQQAVTATGRLSSTDPNLQNIPIRTELGRSIRSAFVAPPGHQLVSADYSQIELRVLAHLSQDPVLLDAFRSGQDIHARTAMEIFDVGEAQLTTELRRRAKAVNFGIIYGQGDSGLAKSVGISRAEASNFIAAYYRRYQGVRRFMLDETLVQAQASESVRSLLGRRRLVPDIRSGNRAKRLAAERIAMNMPIQGTAADLLKLAMLELADPVTPGTKMILTVHDELVFEVPDAEVPEASERIREVMEGVYDFAVPLVVEVGHGPTWKDAH